VFGIYCSRAFVNVYRMLLRKSLSQFRDGHFTSADRASRGLVIDADLHSLL